MSLLREIQNDLASASGDVTAVLRKCKILAARLGSEEFSRWVDLELNGYPESEPTPEYRQLSGACYADFISVTRRADKQTVPWFLIPEKDRDALHPKAFREGIAKAAAFIPEGAHIDLQPMIFRLQGRMYPDMTCVRTWMEIPGSEFEQLVSAVKNRILDFVLKIEAENPDAGEAPINSQPVPAEKLQPLVNNFFGPVGNVAQHGRDFSQTANIGIQPQDLTRLVTDFANHIHELNLDERQRRKAEAQIATLKAQLTDEPDPVIVQQAGRTLRSITEGAIGSLLATAVQPTVWHTIKGLLALFPH